MDKEQVDDATTQSEDGETIHKEGQDIDSDTNSKSTDVIVLEDWAGDLDSKCGLAQFDELAFLTCPSNLQVM